MTSFKLKLQQLAVDLEHSIETHAKLALAQIQIDAQRAHRHIFLLLENYRIQDVFKRRSEAQKLRWKRFHTFNKETT